MKEKPHILEQTFDRLSSFPYFNLRKTLKGMWLFSTCFFAFTLLMEGIAIFQGKMELQSEWVKNLVMWGGINPVFAYVFYLWNKRDNSRKNR
jgi:hypothetical protein